MFCKGSGPLPVHCPSAELLGGHTDDRLCLVSALQDPGHGVMADRKDELKAGGLCYIFHLV